MSDIDIVVVVRLKALDPEWPIREAIGGKADITATSRDVAVWTHDVILQSSFDALQKIHFDLTPIDK